MFPSMGSGVNMGTCLLGDTIQPTTRWACGFGGRAHPGEAPMLPHPTRGPRHAHVTPRWTPTSGLRDPFSTLISTQGPQSPREGWEQGRRGVGAYDQASPTGPACTWSLAAGAVWARSPPLPHSGPQAALGHRHSTWWGHRVQRPIQCIGGETEAQQTPGRSWSSQLPDHCP